MERGLHPEQGELPDADNDAERRSAVCGDEEARREKKGLREPKRGGGGSRSSRDLREQPETLKK